MINYSNRMLIGAIEARRNQVAMYTRYKLTNTLTPAMVYRAKYVENRLKDLERHAKERGLVLPS